MLSELGPFFRRFAEVEAPHSPLYQSICRAVADAPDVASMLNVAPAMERRPNLLLAAVHSILLQRNAPQSTEEHALRCFYPTVVHAPSLDSDPAGQAFVTFCRSATKELAPLLATRSTQTNEVGRSSILWPVLSTLGSEVGPLHLVEVGASAGLNLVLDRWAYCDSNGELLSGGDPASAVRLRATHYGVRPGNEVLAITSRVGLDRNPIDVTNPDAARWLLACMWPDELDRFRRTEQAIAVAALAPPLIRQGDAVDDLLPLTNTVGTGHLTIVTTWVLTYLLPQARTAFVTKLDQLGATRDLTWVFAESSMYSPELPWPTDSSAMAQNGETLVVEVQYRSGTRTTTTRAIAHPHGRHIRWQTT